MAQSKSATSSAAGRIFPRASWTILMAIPIWGQTNVFPGSGNVGIGTTSPSYALDVGGAGNPGNLYSRLGGMSILKADNGYEWWTGSFTDYTSWQVTRRNIANGNWNNALTITTSGNVGIGTTSPQHLLHVAGTIGAEEVIVSSTGADYVFDSNYRLTPLTEVADYIKENHHLPEIPSGEEIEEKGLSVGEMQAKLLAKIEELTLHMIAAEKQSDELARQNRELQHQVQELRNQISEKEKP